MLPAEDRPTERFAWVDRVVREYDPTGKVVWEVKTPHMPFTAVRLPDGNTLIGCTLGNLVIEVDKGGKTVWQVTNDDLPGKPINDACGVQRFIARSFDT